MKKYPRQVWVPHLVAILVAITGLVTISSTLEALVHLHRSRIVGADAHTTLLAGLSLIYLATLLRRGKRTAWLVSLPIFIFLVARNIRHYDIDLFSEDRYGAVYYLNLFLPVFILALLAVGRKFFNVRSEVRSFTTALRRAAIVLAVAFLYGVVGFQLMDKRDFHQEIAVPTGAHYTVDQFGLTTDRQLTPYTHRANLFLDSLAAMSIGSIFYTAIALFSPVRFRLISHQRDYDDMKTLLQKYPGSSEDFFKLWPRDKAYFFSPLRRAAVSYRAANGVAIAVGDPAGQKNFFSELINNFEEFCRLNDWQPMFIHTSDDNLKLYEKHGYEAQKLGEEAVLDLKNFTVKTGQNKYFRHIKNKFGKLGYTCEVLNPPHSQEVLSQLMAISDDWLKVPGRSERGFVMGYFNDEYIQQCPVMVARDASGNMQAFINQLPNLNTTEANYDFLRHKQGSLGNINDYLMLNFINYLASQGFSKLNMGLCPLSGLKVRKDSNYDNLDRFLHLVYENSSRFYSFQGLRRFKEKYEPEWRDRYIVYKGGLVGLTKASNALVRAMRL